MAMKRSECWLAIHKGNNFDGVRHATFGYHESYRKYWFRAGYEQLKSSGMYHSMGIRSCHAKLDPVLTDASQHRAVSSLGNRLRSIRQSRGAQ